MTESLEDRIDYVESRITEVDEAQSDIRLTGEAIRLIHGILSDLIPQADTDEYTDDLARLEQIGNLIR